MPMSARMNFHAHLTHDEYAAGGGNHIGEAVAELEGQHSGLAADTDKVGELRHDGHGEGGFGRAGGHDEVEKCLEDIHGPYRRHFACFCQRACESVEERVDNLAVLEDEDDAAGQAHHQCGGEDVLASGEEELGNVVG